MHRLLEEYLAEVAAKLSALPIKQRNEELREMRTHLLSTVEAHQELGASEQEAVEATLRQFGSSSEAARGLTHAWRRGQGSWLDVAKSAVFGAGALWSISAFCEFLGHSLERHPDAFSTLRSYFEPLFYFLLFGLSALLGRLAGGRVALKGIAWGAGLGYVVPMSVYAVMHAWSDSDVLGVSLLVLLQAACLTGAAWAGRRWRLRPAPALNGKELGGKVV